MKRWSWLGMVSAGLLLLAPAAGAQAASDAPAAQAEPKMQTHCPIMGGEIDKEVYTDFEGKRVYFCCPGCIPKFKEDPAGHIQRLEAEGFTFYATPQPQKMCPVMEEPIDKAIFLDYEGQRIYFCCEPCINQFNKNPAKFMQVLAERGVELEKAPAEGEQDASDAGDPHEHEARGDHGGHGHHDHDQHDHDEHPHHDHGGGR